MFEICEFCPVMEGARRKRLPFGNKTGDSLVILEADYKMGEAEQNELLRSFPGAYFVFRRACVNVDSIEGNLCCGILIRNTLHLYKVIVLHASMTKEFFGVEIVSGIAEHKTGQILVAYTRKPTATEVEKEFERALKQI